jgi:phosphoribosylaminoimidazolecarboxamide formyltransferase/IMP cyclohydrolase
MGNDLQLKYGCNPHQTFARVELPSDDVLRVLNGTPSFINILDALNGWQLVRELRRITGMAAATSFKHVSPAGVAVAGAISAEEFEAFDIAEPPASAIANAYLRARETDPKSSFGDFVAVSEPVDISLAHLLKMVVSDGIIAPAFDDDALPILRAKKSGQYLVVQIDPRYEPPPREERMVFGFVLRQERNSRLFTAEDIADPVVGSLTDSVKLDLLVALTTLKYTQSNSIVCALNGQTVGVGAGQQSRIDCTRIACHKSDVWRFRQHPAIRALRFTPLVKRQDRINWRVRIIEGNLDAAELAELEDVLLDTIRHTFAEASERAWLKTLPPISLASDGYLPFPDNVREAHRHHVGFIAHPGGSTRDDLVTAACRDLGITLVNTGVRAFHH